MLLTPAAARPWLAPDSRNRPWPGHGAMLVRRREALDALYPAYGSWARLGVGALAWAMGVGAAVLVGRGVSAGGEGPTTGIGIGLLLAATFLGGAVVATGSSLARSVAAWWTLATAVGADGGRADATAADPDTRRAHEETVARDRAGGAWELWRMPLLPRALAALLLTVGGVVLLVRAGLGYGEVSTPFAGDDIRGEWLTGVVAALVCLLTGALTASGLRRVHRGRMHRVAHDERAASEPGAGAITPAVGSGAIVVGGRSPGTVAGPPPGWASAPSAPSSDAAPVAPPAPDAPSGGPHPGGSPRVRLSDGRELAPGTTLVGRAPRPRPDEHVDAALAIADERVSKTHLTVRIDEVGVVVIDRGSTNGTVVHEPAGNVAELHPGEPYEPAEGAVVVLGATTLTVGEPADDVEHTVLRAP